jgi:hypothetical protein
LKQAISSDDKDRWIDAINSENSSLLKNQTFKIQKRSNDIRVLGLKWVFKVKEALDGSIDRYKARCTVLGNLQREGFDYSETFSPVVRYSTVRMLLSQAAKKKHVVHQMDVDTSFLYGEMPADTPVYIEIPHDYPLPPQFKNVPRSQLCGKLNKSLYGLKQSPRLWNENLNKTMTSRGFSRCKSDSCLYYRSNGGEVLYVAVFVDDLIISGSSLKAVNKFKSELKDTYSMKDLGEIKYCLGIEVKQEVRGKIKLTQSKYINDILKRFGMSASHSEPTPMIPGTKLKAIVQSPEAKEKAERFPYREIVGSCMYLMVSTRPDISYAVGQLAKYMNSHGPEHHAAANHLLRYLKGSVDVGITYSPDVSDEIIGYSDSDWASDIDTRKSTTGYVFFSCGGPISWKSRLQPTVALSSTEAEYMALSSAAQEAIYLKSIGSDFKMNTKNPIIIREDNQGAIAMSLNPVDHKASKHIAIKHHFIREKVADKQIELEYVSTLDMTADVLTKSLSKVKFLDFRKKLMNC